MEICCIGLHQLYCMRGSSTLICDIPNELSCIKTYKMTFAPSNNSDQSYRQSDQSLLSGKDSKLTHADSSFCCDCADGQADLSLNWVLMKLCRFCCPLAQMIDLCVNLY